MGLLMDEARVHRVRGGPLRRRLPAVPVEVDIQLEPGDTFLEVSNLPNAKRINESVPEAVQAQRDRQASGLGGALVQPLLDDFDEVLNVLEA